MDIITLKMYSKNPRKKTETVKPKLTEIVKPKLSKSGSQQFLLL